jgi:hypothetical protein
LVLAGRSSDHTQFLSLYVLRSSDDVRWNKWKKFRFKASWAMEVGYKEVIKKAWQARIIPAHSWGVVRGKLKQCQKLLQISVKKDRKTVDRVAD